ncbi:MAG: hypothetical protein KDB27_15065 [Planctomycetales bacterium]|nr:hypothetical protein [Planctomycetales bacterium]
MRHFLLAVALSMMIVCPAVAESWGLNAGNAELKMAGPLAFGPDGILFVGDTRAATIVAIDTEDTEPSGLGHADIKKIDQQIAALLGTKSDDILINDMVVNPKSGNIYFSVSRGRGPDSQAVILRTTGAPQLAALNLSNVKHAVAKLGNAPAASAEGRDPRAESITDLAYMDGKLIVAGLSNEEFASKLRAVAFSFDDVDGGVSVEVYHGAHGGFETRSPVRTFVPFTIEGEPHLLAAYTCTPLVKFPISELVPETKKVIGTTVAELGNRNRPLDMIAYKKGDKDFLLVSNSARGVMKIDTSGLSNADPITSRVPNGQTAGVGYDTIDELEGVVQLDKVDDEHGVILVQNGDNLDIRTIHLP